MTVVADIEDDITSNFLFPKKVKANPRSFTQKAELAITIKIILGPIHIKQCV